MNNIEGYEWYRKLKKEISENKDIEKSINLKKLLEIYPHLSEKILLEFKIKKLQSQLKNVHLIEEERHI